MCSLYTQSILYSAPSLYNATHYVGRRGAWHRAFATPAASAALLARAPAAAASPVAGPPAVAAAAAAATAAPLADCCRCLAPCPGIWPCETLNRAAPSPAAYRAGSERDMASSRADWLGLGSQGWAKGSIVGNVVRIRGRYRVALTMTSDTLPLAPIPNPKPLIPALSMEPRGCSADRVLACSRRAQRAGSRLAPHLGL